MTTNVPGTRPSSRPGDQAVGDTTPVVSPTGVGGVAVYDTDNTTNATLRPSASRVDDRMVDDRAPAEVRSGGSVMTWIISVIVLIVLAYFLLQFIF